MIQEKGNPGSVERKAAICGVCPGGCGIIATVKDGRLTKVEADKDSSLRQSVRQGQGRPGDRLFSGQAKRSPHSQRGEGRRKVPHGRLG